MLDPTDLETFPAWEPERITGRATHVVLECSGKKAAIEAGFHQLRRGGTLVLVGAGLEHPAFDPNRFVLNELHVVGSFVYDLDGFERALDLLASDGLPHRSAHRGGGRAPRPAVRGPLRTGRGPTGRQGHGGAATVGRRTSDGKEA